MSSVNQFKDTIIYGNFQNKDNYKAGGNICNATFDRSITVGLTGYFKNSIGVTGDANVYGNIKGNTGFFNNGLGITGDVSLSGNLKNSTIVLPSFTGFLKYQSGSSTPNIIFPNNDVNDITIVSTGNTQTLSNKTLTAPRMTTPLITSGGIGVTGNALFNNDITVSGVSYLKGGNNINNILYTHFPYTDGINYITGQTILRGGNISISGGLLTCSNGLTVNTSITLPNTQVIN
jgi:hypothetical protein